MNKQKQKGFTLIELLVVVAIIGVLATIVLSSLSEARQRAQVARANNDMRQIYTAIETTRIFENKTLLQITGSACTNCFNQWEASIDAIITTADPNITDGSAFYTDIWGNAYRLNENEGESSSNPCIKDSFFSYGPDGTGGGNDNIYFDIPFSLGQCL